MSPLDEKIKNTQEIKKLLEYKDKGTPVGAFASYVFGILQAAGNEMDLTISNDGKILFLAPVLNKSFIGNSAYFRKESKLIAESMYFYSHDKRTKDVGYSEMINILPPKILGVNTEPSIPYTFAVYAPNTFTDNEFGLVGFINSLDLNSEGTFLDGYESVQGIPELQQLRVKGNGGELLTFNDDMLLRYLLN